MKHSTPISKQWTLIIVLMVSLPFSYQCIDAPLDPVMPKWTTQLTVQLIKRTYFFEDMIRKDSSKFATINGELVYKPASQTNAPKEITIPDMKPVEAELTQALGLIPITAVTVPGAQIGSQLNGLPLAQKVVIDTAIVIGDTTLYEYLVYEDGRMTINLANTMNIDWTFTTPIQVFNSNAAGAELSMLGQFNIGTVNANGGTKSDFFAITQPQNGYLKLKFKLETEAPVSPLPPFKTITGGNLSIGFGITSSTGGNPSLSEAKMKLLQEFYLPVKDTTAVQKLDDKDKDAVIDSTIMIDSVTFKGGQFDIVINNGIAFDVIIGFKFREFVNRRTGASFLLKDQDGVQKDTIVIKGRSSYTETVRMEEYKIEARKEDFNPDTLTSAIHFSLSIKTLVKSATKVVIKKTDSVQVKIVPKQTNGVNDPYVVDVVRGKIPPNVVVINNSIPAGVGQSNDNFSADSIKFDGAQIQLRIFTESLFPTDLRFTVKGFSNGVVTDSLSTPKGIGANSSPDGVSYRIFPGDTAKITFDKFNPDANGKTIDQFLSKFIQNGKFKFPDRFDVYGTATIEPIDQYNDQINPSAVGVIKNDDSVYTSLDFSFPLKIGIMNGLYLADTASIAGNADTSMTSSIVEGTIGFNLASTFPVALDIYSNLIKADPLDPTKPSRDTLTNSVIRFPKDSTKLPLGVPGALDNQVKIEYRDITLTGDDAKKVAEAKFTAIQVKMRTAADNGNTPLAFVIDDSLQVITVANIKFKVDQDKLK
jgi:hypothetical protein